MQNITPFLWFDSQAGEAADFYVSIFRDSRVLKTVRYGDSGPSAPGSVMTVEFELDGLRLVALNRQLLGETVGRRQAGPLRLAQGSVRPVLADCPPCVAAAPRRS